MEPTPSTSARPARRIVFLDGLRGVAILVVMLYHAFVRWPELYVYGARFVGNPFLDTSIAGVNLFFIISGFVILMTLRKCRNLWDFLLRRWVRLFPAMLVCSLLILLTAGLFPERPRGDIHLWDLLPGVTFIGDGETTRPLWDTLAEYTGFHASSIEGAFWSLYVEVRFYILFGAAYFFLGEGAGIGLLIGLFLLGRIASGEPVSLPFVTAELGRRTLESAHQGLAVYGFDWLADFLTLKAYGFFATGALFYVHHVTRRAPVYWTAVGVGLMACLGATEGCAADLWLTLLFALAMAAEPVRHLLASRWLVFIGFISYPLYLLHENMMVAMIVKLGRAHPHAPALLIPLLPACAAGLVAWVIARYVEPATRRLLVWRPRPRSSLVTGGS